MVGSDKDNKPKETELEESKMIDEGGIGVESDYNYDDIRERKNKIDAEELEESEMVDEGGLGATLYYDKEEMIVDPDAKDKKSI